MLQIKKLFALILTFLLLSINSTPVLFAEEPSQVAPARIDIVDSRQLDERAKILQAYFIKYNSPLQYHAQDFVDAADANQMDWMLVPAIAGVESTFGKFIPGGHGTAYTSYNAWGWGVYGTQSLGFDSWRHGIFTVSNGLKKNYINKGLTDPYAMNKVYAASPVWGQKVSYFLADLQKFTINYQATQQSQTPQRVNPELFKSAGVSAQPAF